MEILPKAIYFIGFYFCDCIVHVLGHRHLIVHPFQKLSSTADPTISTPYSLCRNTVEAAYYDHFGTHAFL